MNYIQRIRDLREDKDLKQSDIANILKTTQGYYSKYELGVRELPIHHLITLCQFYDVSADYILGFTNTKKEMPRK
ncbi:helix-turn-helix transcriptional regulator [uncultured Eubacterium sp.]|uniref:helix-turn-helix domain-containing protein n=1 Tax=uncultured Eubacterium sp. TaxID=165185 RepID=UPI0025DE5F5C|nr:helix-turn-helix transcriptional regulator [uncultured Eubacterium sp.]